MTTAAKRARKKANKEACDLRKAAELAEKQLNEFVNDPVATESEHAAAMTALAQVKRMRNRKAE